ncbi:hypothetical protein GCM10022288_04690 [Gryllotalpicola kribbensis]|uniref:Uncharacterized protein n=1 Tax=Gryllotalpicola kribbensis TaxID=993084 RepID=A0ABP8AHZ3_9MICO
MTATSTWPRGSSRRRRPERDSGTNRKVKTIAATPIGMFIQKIPRHPTESVSAPPTNGPIAMETPTTADQTPTARARRAGSVKVAVMIDIATGFSMEPPSACMMRKAISQPTPGATLQSNEPAVKIARPSWKVLRRPMRSAVEPDRIRKLASTRVYASMVHCSPATEDPKSRRIEGKATFTAIESIDTTSRLMQQMPRIR